MTAFTDTVLTVLLGWVKGLASAVWQFFADGAGSGWIGWLGEHWLPLTIALAAVFTVADLAVYILRWRPNRVWATALRHLRGEYELSPVGDGRKKRLPRGAKVRRWVYADGSQVEEVLPP